jgi:hypothetical protein
MTWERKILRKTCGPMCENVLWSIKMDQDICNKFKSADTEVHTLEWLGHVVRMDGEGTVKKLLVGRQVGHRKKGRLRLKWVDDVEVYLRRMGVKRWRKGALNRTEWA